MPSYGVKNARELGAVIKAAREDRGMSRQDAAERINVTRQYVYDIETRFTALYITRLFRLLAALGVKVTLSYEKGDGSA